MAKDNLPQLDFISWQQFHHDSFELAKLLHAREFDLIISVSRGGHVLSRILSDFLQLPIFNVSVQSYTAIGVQGNLKMTQKLGRFLAGQRVLLVDEIVDSGKTLAHARKYLHRLRAKDVYSVALYVKPQAKPRPDLFHHITEKWVVFPYEVHETIQSLIPLWQKAAKPISDLKQKLIEGGIRSIYVDFFLSEKLAAADKKSKNKA